MSTEQNINENLNNPVTPSLNINQSETSIKSDDSLIKTEDQLLNDENQLLNAENQIEKSGEEIANDSQTLIKDENQSTQLENNNETVISTPEIINSEDNSKTLPQLDQSDVVDEDNNIKNNNTTVPDSNTTVPDSNTTVPEDQTNNSNNSNGELTFKVDKNTLTSLCQNLNSNLLVNIVAYIGVLTKLKDSETNEQKKTELENNISNLKQIQDLVSSLMSTVQANLDIPQSQSISPEEIIKEASKSTTLADQLISAQVTTILASLAAAAVLAGGKKHKRKNTKRKRNKPKKHTKKHH